MTILEKKELNYAIINVSKPIQCVAPRVNSNINYEDYDMCSTLYLKSTLIKGDFCT